MIWPFNRVQSPPPAESRDTTLSWNELLGPAKTPSEQRIAHHQLAAAYEDIKAIIRYSAEAKLSDVAKDDTPALVEANRELRELSKDGKRIYHLLAQLAAGSFPDGSPGPEGRRNPDGAFASLDAIARSLRRTDDTRAALLSGKLDEALAELGRRAKDLSGHATGTAERAASLSAEYRPISPAEAQVIAPDVVKAAAHYGRVAIIGKRPSNDDAAALALLLEDADVAVTADGSSVVPLRPRWQEVLGPAVACRIVDSGLDAARHSLREREESTVRELVEVFGELSEKLSRGERRELTDELVALRRELRENVTIARHWLDCSEEDRFGAAIDQLGALESRIASRLGELRESLGPPASSTKARLSVENIADRPTITSELSEMTERHLYKPGDPRIWDYGGTVTAQSAETFDSLLREGAHLTTIRDGDGSLAGYVLHLDPEHAAERWSRLAARYDPYGKAAFIYFIVSDGRASSGALMYETLLASVTIQLGDADVVAGLVVEDNLRGMVVHTASGGGQIYPGDWKNFVSDFDSRVGEERASAVALGIAFGASPEWRQTFAETQPSRRDCVEVANEILMRRYRGVFADDLQNILKAIRKTQMRDLYLTALMHRAPLLEDVRRRAGNEALEPSRPIEFVNATYNEDLLQVIHPDTPPLQRLRAAVEMTLSGLDLRRIDDARIWERISTGTDAHEAVELLARIVKADAERHEFFSVQKELIFEVWSAQDELIAELNQRYPRNDRDWSADVYYLGVDEWPHLLKKIAIAATAARDSSES